MNSKILFSFANFFFGTSKYLNKNITFVWIIVCVYILLKLTLFIILSQFI